MCWDVFEILAVVRWLRWQFDVDLILLSPNNQITSEHGMIRAGIISSCHMGHHELMFCGWNFNMSRYFWELSTTATLRQCLLYYCAATGFAWLLLQNCQHVRVLSYNTDMTALHGFSVGLSTEFGTSSTSHQLRSSFWHQIRSSTLAAGIFWAGFQPLAAEFPAGSFWRWL